MMEFIEERIFLNCCEHETKNDSKIGQEGSAVAFVFEKTMIPEVCDIPIFEEHMFSSCLVTGIWMIRGWYMDWTPKRT